VSISARPLRGLAEEKNTNAQPETVSNISTLFKKIVEIVKDKGRSKFNDTISGRQREESGPGATPFGDAEGK